jgi:hypothetical protein
MNAISIVFAWPSSIIVCISAGIGFFSPSRAAASEVKYIAITKVPSFLSPSVPPMMSGRRSLGHLRELVSHRPFAFDVGDPSATKTPAGYRLLRDLAPRRENQTVLPPDRQFSCAGHLFLDILRSSQRPVAVTRTGPVACSRGHTLLEVGAAAGRYLDEVAVSAAPLMRPLAHADL